MEVIDEEQSYIAAQYRVASISYGIFFCLIGTVFNTIEPFKACKNLKLNLNFDYKGSILSYEIYKI